MSQKCKVCLAQHDDEIHAATNRVHGWFRSQVTKRLYDEADVAVMAEEPEFAATQLNAA